MVGVSAGDVYVGGTRCSGIASSTSYVLGMRVVRGMK